MVDLNGVGFVDAVKICREIYNKFGMDEIDTHYNLLMVLENKYPDANKRSLNNLCIKLIEIVDNEVKNAS